MSRGRMLVAALALLLLAYVGGYFALSDPCLAGVDLGGGGTHRMAAHYRAGGEASRVVFCPLEMADRPTRPTFWAPHTSRCVIPVYEPPKP